MLMRQQYQQRILEQRSTGAAVKRGVDAAFDQPRQGDAGEIGSDQRKKAEDEKAAVALDQKLDTVVVAKNCDALGCAGLTARRRLIPWIRRARRALRPSCRP
jgi:putative intracellular protease/amidase